MRFGNAWRFRNGRAAKDATGGEGAPVRPL